MERRREYGRKGEQEENLEGIQKVPKSEVLLVIELMFY